MKYRPTNTLAHFKSAPWTHYHDLSGLPTAVFAAATKAYRQSCGEVKPEELATSFYVLNHAASIVGKRFTLNETLPLWAQQIMTLYSDATMAQGERMLHYLLSIATRETRHMHEGEPSFWNGVKTKFGQKAVDALKDIRSTNDEFVAVNKYMNTPPDLPIGQYAKALAHGFHKGSYTSGYGGKAWGVTTDAAVAMLHGDTTMEMMVDTGYTLCHNGGPVFDKGMMYASYQPVMFVMLDVQHVGQLHELMLGPDTLPIPMNMPGVLNGHGKLSIPKPSDAILVAGLLKDYAPEAFTGAVDWKQVKGSRAESSASRYPTMYDAVLGVDVTPKPKPKYKPTIKPPVPPKPVVPKPTLASTLTVDGKKVKVTGTWQVAPAMGTVPEQTVTVFARTEK